MKILVGDRCSGKTTAIKEAMRENSDMVVIVPNEGMGKTYYDEFGRDRVITAKGVQQGRLRGKTLPIAIDELQYVLPVLLECGIMLKVATVTSDNLIKTEIPRLN